MKQFWKHNPQALFKKGIVGGGASNYVYANNFVCVNILSLAIYF